MAHMEVNAGEPFDTTDQTVTGLITWLQSQDQNSVVKLQGNGHLVFRRLRVTHGGGIEVEAVKERKRRSKKDDTDETEEHPDTVASDESKVDPKKDPDVTKANQDKQMKEHEDSILGINQGHDQGGVVPGTSKTPSDKVENEKGQKTGTSTRTTKK